MFTIQKAEHALSSVAHDIVRVARAVAPVLQKVQAQESNVEALTGLVDPRAVDIERAAFAVLGKACVAITDAGSAGAANGLKLQLDGQEITDLKAIAAHLQSAARTAGVMPAGSTVRP